MVLFLGRTDVRIVRYRVTDKQTNRQTQLLYPRCACAPRVIIYDVGVLVFRNLLWSEPINFHPFLTVGRHISCHFSRCYLCLCGSRCPKGNILFHVHKLLWCVLFVLGVSCSHTERGTTNTIFWSSKVCFVLCVTPPTHHVEKIVVYI